jgi:DNA-binding MarR family transcriptional regulator
VNKIPKAIETVFLLNETHDLIVRARDLGLGIPSEQADILRAVSLIESTEKHATPSKLARMMTRAPHTMSGMLNRMEDNGLVKRKRRADPRKNIIWIELTPKGQEALKTAENQLIAETIFSSIGSGERMELVRILEKLRNKALHKIKDLQPLPYALKGKT